MSRVEKFKTKSFMKNIFFNGAKENNNVPIDETFPSKEKINYIYSIITALVVSGLLYILKLLVGLEKQLFIDSQYKLNEIWNLSLYIGEAMFISAFIPVGIFMITFVFYFVSSSNISMKKLENSYSRAIFYLIYCTLFTLCIIPAFVLAYYGENSTSIFFQIVSAILVSVFIPQKIIRTVTKEQTLRKGYFIYLFFGLVFLLILITKPLFKDMVPSLTVEKSIYFSSEDKIVLATFEGNAIEGFLCPVNKCLDKPDEGILLDSYLQAGVASRSTFIVNLSDPNITTGTYEIRVYYQSDLPIIGGSRRADQQLDNKKWYENSISRKFHYIFDGQTTDDRKQYFMKYINRMKMNLKRDDPDYLKLNEEILKFVTVMEQNEYYISEDIDMNEVRTLLGILPDPVEEIFGDLVSDLVFYTGI